MTTICAFPTGDGRVIVGSDQQRTYKNLVVPCGPKWRINGGRAAAACGHSRAATLLSEGAKDLLADTGPDVPGGTSSAFVFWERYIASAQRYGCAPVEVHREPFKDYGADFLYTDRGRLWHIASEGGVITEMHQFWAVGSGAPYALGAWYGASEMATGLPGVTRMMRVCLEAAIKFDTSSGGEPWVSMVLSKSDGHTDHHQV